MQRQVHDVGLQWPQHSLDGTDYLPAWLGNVLKIGEVVLDPSVNILQGHALPLRAVDGELYHSHVRVRRSFGHRVLPGC